jgi:AraC-like DNA-binding protein
MDPLSDVLSLVKITNHWSERFQWGKDWCLEFGPHGGIRTYAVMSGSCWLAVEGVRRPVEGNAGDCLLLPSGRAFRVGSNLKLPAMSAERLSLGDTSGALPKRYAGNAFIGLGSHFTLDGEHAAMLTTALPSILHIRDEKNKAVLRWTLDRLADELNEPQPGGALVIQQLSTLLVVQALRVHLSQAPSADIGWLSAMRDRRIRMALSAMHAEPGRRWTVQSLGAVAGMSRTSFAIRFKETVGKGPLEYLTEWRMMLASDRLTKSSDPISIIAGSLGYESDSAFSTAFKRVMHCSPRHYIRTARKAAARESNPKAVPMEV